MLAAAGVLFDEKRFVEAIAMFERAAQIDPKNPTAHYNAAQLYLNTGKPDQALPPLRRTLELEPNNWKIRTKIIQALQGMGRKEERDREVAALCKLWKEGKVDAESYCRERFMVGEKEIVVYEFFELKGPRPHKYHFYVDRAAGKSDFFVSLGSYEATNALFREQGKLGKEERVFHIDGWEDESSVHYTYGFLKEPAYDEMRGIVVEIVTGERQPLSSSRLSKPAKEGDK